MTFTPEQIKQAYIDLANAASRMGYSRVRVLQSASNPLDMALCLGWDWSEHKSYPKFEAVEHAAMEKYGMTFEICADSHGGDYKSIY